MPADHTRPRRRPRTLRRLLLGATAALVGGLGLVAPAVPAVAHGGDIVISLGTDGAGGISANLTYRNDGHPVEESADVTVTAQSDDGATVGPVALQSSSEGVGWYVSEPGVLAEGHWLLTATITTPSEATASTQVDVVAAPDEPPVGDDDADAAGDGEAGVAAGSDAAADPAEDASGAGPTEQGATESSDGAARTTWAVVPAVAVVVLAGTSVVLARRRRAHGPPPARAATSRGES